MKAIIRQGIPFFYNKEMQSKNGLTTVYDTWWAKVVCGTLMRTRIAGNDDWTFPETYKGTKFEDYNTVIRKASRKNHCCLADLSALGIRYETADGTHPTKIGHQEIANAYLHFLL